MDSIGLLIDFRSAHAWLSSPNLFVDLSGVRTASDLALGAATCCGLSTLLDTPILDIEGCYRGRREESAASFIDRLRIKGGTDDYSSATLRFVAKSGQTNQVGSCPTRSESDA